MGNIQNILFEKIEYIKKVISDGGECMIGNCDRIIEKGPDYIDYWMPIIDLWIYKENNIEKQSEQCIDYVYSLCKAL